MFGLMPQQIEAFRSLLVGFAFAGFVASAFNWVAEQPPSFRMLERGGLGAVVSVPLIVFAAPFLILRNTIRGRRHEKRNIVSVMLATLVACGWSMAAGRVLIALLANV